MVTRLHHWLTSLLLPRRLPAAERLVADGGRRTEDGGRRTGDPGPNAQPRAPGIGHPAPGNGSRLGQLVTAYLNAPADEVLALLVEELNRETLRALGEALEQARATLSEEITGVQESMRASQREVMRMGRELVRSGAALESIQGTVAGIGPALEQSLASLRTELARQQGRERKLREETERAALDDMLATLDGLELGLEVGHDVVRALADAHLRLDDPVVQRWWRAISEAAGIERRLPGVPLADVEGWISGLELTYRRLSDAVARRGVTPIEAVGKPFDPHLHEAVAVEPCPPEQDGLVLREQRRGYRTSERVVRLAQVVVGRATSDE